MKLIAYTRISTLNQDKGFSLEIQKENIKTYCSLYNHQVIEFVEEVGTGAIKNDGLKEVLNKILKEPFLDGIVVDKIDRFFRNTEELLKTLRELKEKGKTFISVNEQFDISTITGELSITVISAFAEFEKKRIRERIMLGKKAKMDAGGFIGGGIPYGYQTEEKITTDGKTIKVLTLNQGEQLVIEKARSLRSEGKSFSEIAKELNMKGYKTKKNKLFTATQIFRFLTRNN